MLRTHAILALTRKSSGQVCDYPTGYMNKGTLYSVALPIGNAGDITDRARAVLADVDFIAAEDTRKALDWFRRCGIQYRGKVLAHHSHNERNSASGLLSLLEAGKSVALVTDAGTPRISDPGYVLVNLAWQHGIPVRPVPGPSSITCLLSVSPFPTEPFLYLGFLSPKEGKVRKELNLYNSFAGSVMILESQHRIEKLLAIVQEEWGDIPLLVGREMTKEHEEFKLGTVASILEKLGDPRGEYSLLFQKK